MMRKRTSPKHSNTKVNIVKRKVSSNKLKAYSKSINKKKKKSKKKRIITNIFLTIVIIGILAITGFFAYIVIHAPKFDPNNLKFTQMSEIYDADGNLITKMGNENRTQINYDSLPEVLIDAIIATEDARFFQHNGFDLARFMKASVGQAMGKNSGGASTLTMQIVKNNYTSTVSTGVKGILRKFTDIYISIFKVEKKYTKKEIIEFYVNDSYLGNGAYGVEQASKNYFGKSVGELNLAEASFIAGLFQSPANYNPYNYSEKAEKRRNTVLYLMQRHGYINEEERKIASSTPISSLVKKTQSTGFNSQYQGYIDTVVEELEDTYNLNPYTTPLKIYTAMNRSKQDFINKVMNGEAWGWENDMVQAGVVMTDSYTGEVIAVGAGRNKSTERSFNYATMTNRHVGSTAKPIFDYGPAVEYLGWGTVNYIDDTPTSYSNGKPISNSDGGYRGRLPLYQALGLSRNITALKTFQEVSREVGNDKIVKFATNLGLTPEIENGKVHEAHSIGAFTGSTKKGESRNSPMTMAGAYGAFSNGGTYIKPHTIKKFIYIETDEVKEFEGRKERVMNDSTAYIINYALNWSATEGLARSAAGIWGVQTAAKTGTSNVDSSILRSKGISSNHVNDLWVCGYSPSQVITFWYGYDKLTSEHYSTTSTWTIRDRFYRNLAENLFDKTGAEFPRPSSIEEVYVVPGSIPLKRAISGGVIGFFRKNTAPTDTGIDVSEGLPRVSNLSAKLDGTTVTLTWNGLSAEDMLNISADDSYGTLGYDIYVKDGDGGSLTYVGTTTSSSYKHTTNYSNPVYVVYTAFSNYKNNRSEGAEVSVKIKSSFEIKISNSTINQGEVFIDTIPIIVWSNNEDVTDESVITLISGEVNTSNPGTYKLTYKITYKGTSKNASRNVTVRPVEQTTTQSSENNDSN